MAQKTRVQLYNRLVRGGYTFGKDGYNQFEKILSDEDLSRELYKNVTRDGIKLGSYDNFIKNYRPVKESPSGMLPSEGSYGYYKEYVPPQQEEARLEEDAAAKHIYGLPVPDSKIDRSWAQAIDEQKTMPMSMDNLRPERYHEYTDPSDGHSALMQLDPFGTYLTQEEKQERLNDHVLAGHMAEKQYKEAVANLGNQIASVRQGIKDQMKQMPRSSVSSSVTGQPYYRTESDDERKNLYLADRILDDAQHRIAESQKEAAGDASTKEWEKRAGRLGKYAGDFHEWGMGVWRGIGERLADLDTYTFGAYEAEELTALRKAIEKSDALEKYANELEEYNKAKQQPGQIHRALQPPKKPAALTQGEQALLDAAGARALAEMNYETGWGHTAGSMAVDMIPFVVQLAASPGAAVSRSVAGGALRHLARKSGVNVTKTLAQESLERGARDLTVSQMRKAFSKELKNQGASFLKRRAFGLGSRLIQGGSDLLITGPLTAVSTGINMTVQDTNRRMIGEVKGGYDDEGNVRYTGHTGGEEYGDALTKAILSSSFEFSSEQMSDWISDAGVMAALGNTKWGKKLKGSKAGQKLAGAIHRAEKTRLGKAANTIRQYGHIGGLGVEYSEEVFNNVLNASFVGDMDWSTGERGVFNLDQNLETLTSLIVPQIAFGVAGGAGAAANKYKTYRAYRSAANQAKNELGGLWESIEMALRTAPEDKFMEVYRAQVGQAGLTARQRAAVAKYGFMRLLNEGMDEMTTEVITTNPFEAELSERHEIGEGMVANPETITDLERSILEAEMVFTPEELDGLMRHPHSVLQMMYQENNPNFENAYKLSLLYAQYRGAEGAWNAETEQMINEECDALFEPYANRDMDSFVEVTLADGRTGYITGGEISVDANGKIVRGKDSASGDMLFFSDRVAPGKPAQITVDDISEVVSIRQTDEVLNEIEGRIINERKEAFDRLTPGFSENEEGQDGRLEPETPVKVNGRSAVVENSDNDGVVVRYEDEDGNVIGRERVSPDAVQPMTNTEVIAPAPSVEAPEPAPETNNETAAPAPAPETGDQGEAPAADVIPMEKVGGEEREAYHLVPMDKTLENLYDGLLQQDEIDGLVRTRISDAEKDVKSIEGKKPTIKGSKAAYIAAVAAWREKLEAAQSKLAYYQELQGRIAERVAAAQQAEVPQTETPQTEASQAPQAEANVSEGTSGGGVIGEQAQTAEAPANVNPTEAPANAETTTLSQPGDQVSDQVKDKGQGKKSKTSKTSKTSFRNRQAARMAAEEEARRKPLRERAKEWEEKLGVKVHLHEDISTVDNVRARDAINRKNKKVGGWYDRVTGAVHLYLPGIDSVEEIDETYLHEVVGHLGLKELMGDRWDALCDDVWNAMSVTAREKYEAYEGVADIQDATRRHRAAADEYMAHLAERTDMNAATEEERDIWQKIVDAFRAWLEKIGVVPSITDGDIQSLIRESYARLERKARGEAETAVSPSAASAEDLSAALDEAGLGESSLAGELRGRAEEERLADEAARQAEDASIAEAERNNGSTELSFSIRTYREGGRDKLINFLERRVKGGKISLEDADDIIAHLDDVYKLCLELKDKYVPFGAWSDASVAMDIDGKPVFSVIKKNGDYAMNIDFSTSCKKRRTLDAVFREMIDRGIIYDYELNGEQIVKINDIIRKHGFETACSLCFVDAKRYRIADVADTFADMYNSMIGMSDRELSKIQRNGTKVGKDGKKTMDVPAKIAKLLLSKPERRVEVSRENFLDTKGFEEMAINAPDILSLYNSKKGTGGPKASYGDTPYLNEVISQKTWTPKKAYAVGGVRLQSFSDYVPRMVFDYMQLISEYSAKELPVHAYTKEELFVKLFGLTGMKINMSLVPKVVEGGIAPGLDAEGNYAWQEGQTFDYDEAIEIQNTEGYKENCGTIAVGISDEHILKMLNDDNIRMVIPYHKSSISPVVAKMANIDKFTDYTKTQNTRQSNGNALTDDQKKKHFSFNEDLHKHGNPRLAAQNYLDWCKQKGFIPKFDKFASHPNYYKLLEDFTTCVTENGKDTFVPQKGVRMVFPTDGSAFGSLSQLIERGLEEDAVLEGKRSAEVGSIVDEVVKALDANEKISFSIREDAPPKKTGIGYKVFYLKDGKLYPPMVANPDGEDTPVGVWLDADASPITGQSKTGRKKVKAGGKGTQGGSGELAFRPGWHLGNIPYALQFNRGEKVDNPLGIKNQQGEIIKVGKFFPKDFVWAEVEYANDVDYQEEAMSYGYNNAGNFQHSLAGLPRIPENGAYIYRTNANPATDPWIISGAMRVKRLLTPTEVDELVQAAGREPQLRQGGAVTDAEIIALNEENGLSKEEISFSIREEEQEIVDAAKRNGTWMKAPNGKPSNLDEKQWAWVRTRAFKKWFGDWEKVARYIPIRNAYSVSDAIKQIEHLINTPLSNKKFDFAAIISRTKVGKFKSEKATKQSVSNRLHAMAIANIDYLFENADIKITHPDTKGNPDIFNVHRFGTLMYDKETNTFVPIKITAFEYNTKTGNRIYSIEAIDVEEIKKSAGQLEDDSKENPRSPIADFNAKIQILVEETNKIAKNSSKIVDENGEPLVVYHDTNSTIYVNNETGENWDDLSWQEKEEWESRDDWEEYWEEQDFYVFDNKNHGRRSIEMPAFFFTPNYDEYHEYGKRTIAAFLNIRNPKIDPVIENAGVTNTAGEDAMNDLISQGYDGFIRTEDGRWRETNAFYPNQIKSATENVGTYDAGQDDIRFKVFGGNSGYVGYSMSRRAAEARKDGRYPKTDFKKEYGITDASLKALVEAGIIDDSEWHHTSKFGNRTTFYGWKDDAYARTYAENKKEIDKVAKAVNKNIEDLRQREKDYYANYKDYEYPEDFDWDAYARRARELEDLPFKERAETLHREFPAVAEAERHRDVARAFSQNVRKEIDREKGRLTEMFERGEEGSIAFKITTGDENLDKELGRALYVINKEAKRYRDLKREYYNHNMTEDVFLALQSLGVLDASLGYENGVLVRDEYDAEYHSTDEIEEALQDSYSEITSHENTLEKDELTDDEREEYEEYIDFEESHIEKLNILKEIFEGYERLRAVEVYDAFSIAINDLYEKKERVLDVLIKEGSEDAVHVFRNGDVRRLYNLGDFSFHGKDISEDYEGDFNELETLDEISSENTLKEGMSVKEAVSFVDEFLSEKIRPVIIVRSHEINEINKIFNEMLDRFTLENADSFYFDLGFPSIELLLGGVWDRPIRLHGSKLAKKAKKHGFNPIELKNLPLALSHPIAVFDNYQKEGNRSVLIELKTQNGNFLLSIDLGKGTDVDFDIIKSMFGKSDSKIVGWILSDYMKWVDKEKALNYLYLSAPIAEASDKSRLASAAKIVEEFVNPSLTSEKISFRIGDSSPVSQLLEDLESGGYKDSGLAAALRAKEEEDIALRVTSVGGASEEYERRTKGFRNNFAEAYVDGLRSLRVMQEAISRETGKKIEDWENVYLSSLNRSSVNKAESDKLIGELIDPLFSFVGELIGGRRFRGRKMRYDDVDMYLNCVHGIERNKLMADRDAQAWKVKHDKWEKDVQEWERKKNAGVPAAQLGDKPKEPKLNVRNDYSGLTALFDPERKANYTMAELAQLAKDYINDFEQAANARGNMTDELWDRIRKINHWTMDKMRKTGMISKEQQDKIESMYQNYVPLRGWDEQTADEVYDYMSGGTPSVSKVIRSADGRESRADNILATLANMANNAIVTGNKNKSKQAMLSLAEDHPTRLLTVSRAYYQETATGDWQLVTPNLTPGMTPQQIEQELSDFEERMTAARAAGLVKTRKEALQLGMPIRDYQAKEHAVHVWRGGKEYVVYVNGNPKAAQAVNGQLNPETQLDIVTKSIAKVMRFMARNVTAFSPEFIWRNAWRDAQAASITSFAKYGTKYTLQFEAELALNAKAFGHITDAVAHRNKEKSVRQLYKALEQGTLDMRNERDRMFKEFVENGGETGYTQSLSVDDFKKRMDRLLKQKTQNAALRRMGMMTDGVLSMVERVNREVENATRFAAYCASRKNGFTILHSISDAKEVSVNFNRKGSGAMGNIYIRSFYMFFNPAVQGLMQRALLFKQHPGRMIATTAVGMTTLGVTATIVNAMLSAALDGDDDDHNGYMGMTKWTQGTNFNIRIGDGRYISIPLPPEERVFFRIGNAIARCMMGYDKVEDLPYEIADAMSMMMPIDVVDLRGLTDSDDSFVNHLVRGFTPAPLAPAVETYLFNEDFAGNPITYRNQFNEHLPEWKRAGRGTWIPLIELSKEVNEWAGGNDYKKGWIDGYATNPSFWQHQLEGTLGGPMSFIAGVSNVVYKLFKSTDVEMRDVPIARTMLKSTTSDYSRNLLIRSEYDYYIDKAQDIDKQIRGFAKEHNLDAMTKVLTGNKEDWDVYTKYVELSPLINAMKKARSEAYDTGDQQKIKDFNQRYYKTLEDIVNYFRSVEDNEQVTDMLERRKEFGDFSRKVGKKIK